MSSSSDLPPSSRIRIRSVWADNLDDEFDKIRSVIDDFPMISMDTEFPGVVFRHNPEDPPLDLSAGNYAVLKANVDRLNLIQVGLTLSDRAGNLPDLGSENQYIWEFNFSDFDVEHDLHAPDSIELLRQQGIDFKENKNRGIESERFAELMMSSGLVCNEDVTWITFHGPYDFGYLVKLLTKRDLPADLAGFLKRVRLFFGSGGYDVKHLTKFCEHLYGGLDRICLALNVGRVAGKSHQAGSDSLLTLHAYQRIKELYFSEEGIEQYAGVLYGLEDEDFVIEKDDGGSPTDDSGGKDSDASESGGEKEKPAKKEPRKEPSTSKVPSSKKKSKEVDDDGPKEKKQKKKKDPNAPRRAMSGFMFFSNMEREVGSIRAMSSFMFFSNMQRENVKKTNRGFSFTDVGRVLGVKWKKMSAEEKEPYEAKGRQDKIRYKDEISGYYKNNAPQPRIRFEVESNQAVIFCSSGT